MSTVSHLTVLLWTLKKNYIESTPASKQGKKCSPSDRKLLQEIQRSKIYEYTLCLLVFNMSMVVLVVSIGEGEERHGCKENSEPVSYLQTSN